MNRRETTEAREAREKEYEEDPPATGIRRVREVHCYVDTRLDCMSDHRGEVRP